MFCELLHNIRKSSSQKIINDLSFDRYIVLADKRTHVTYLILYETYLLDRTCSLLYFYIIITIKTQQC